MTSRQLLLALTLAAAIGCGGSSTQQPPTYAPDARLPHSDRTEPAIDPALLGALTQKLNARDFAKVDSLLLVKNGELVYERYRNGYGPERVHKIGSITKSITSLLVGVAIDRGHIAGVEDTVLSYFADTPYADAWPEEKRSLTLRHLLTMQHGAACDDYADTDMEQFDAWMDSDDRVLAFLAMPMKTPPGERSSYCTASTQLLRQVIEAATGRTIQAFAQEVLFDPLAIRSFQWERSSRHGVAVGFGARACPRDLAVLGRMIEEGGRWNDLQIASQEWIEESFEPRGTLLGIDYGYLWYAETYPNDGESVRSRLAMGHGGQFLILFPELRSILVITASDYDQTIDFYQLIADTVLPILTSP